MGIRRISVKDMDVKSIDILASIYSSASWKFNCKPISASQKMQRKIRRWIEKDSKRTLDDLPKKIFSNLAPGVSDADFFSFLDECYLEIQANGDMSERSFNKITADLSEEEKNILKVLTKRVFFPKISEVGKDVRLSFSDDTLCYYITLKNCRGIKKENQGMYIFDMQFTKKENEFLLFGEVEKADSDETSLFTIYFDGIEAEAKNYNCVLSSQYMMRDPWQYLIETASDIAFKVKHFNNYCNEKEKELLPLLEELNDLCRFISSRLKYVKFPLLKELANGFGHKKIVSILSEMEEDIFRSNKFDEKRNKLKRILCEQKYEPLWRLIFEKISDSQAEYPQKCEVLCDAQTLNDTRASIQRLMEEHGFSGQYPDFQKRGDTHGIRLAESYGISYFIGLEKNVLYRIRCIETFDDNDKLTVSYICATAFLRADEDECDIYSCLFNAKGRRLFSMVDFLHHTESDKTEEAASLETFVSIAVKKTEGHKLTKDEKKLLYPFHISAVSIFLYCFLFFGGFFGITMTLAFMFIEMLVCLIFGEMCSFGELFLDTPWWMLFLFCTVASGGSMGIITVLARRK